jgi:hypothetical protein
VVESVPPALIRRGPGKATKTASAKATKATPAKKTAPAEAAAAEEETE